MREKQFLITEDGSHTIFLPELNETYHSTHGAIRESQYVFVEKGLDRIAQSGKKKINIFEVGFGTGLNALLSLQYSEQRQIEVNYQSIEAYPLALEDISKLNYARQIEGNTVEEKFSKLHESAWNQWVHFSEYFHLKKMKGLLQELKMDEQVDVCFFDAFAPSKQAEMWELPILEKIYDFLVVGGVFVTYCAKGQLKRDLKNLGFKVESLPGPPGKKEMVRATKS